MSVHGVRPRDGLSPAWRIHTPRWVRFDSEATCWRGDLTPAASRSFTTGRRHARILIRGESAILEDLGSVVVGSVAGALLARLMASLLYQVRSFDPITYAAVPAVLMTVALAASYLPARRATRIDPIEALRAE